MSEDLIRSHENRVEELKKVIGEQSLQIDALRQWLDTAYDHICEAIYNEDGLDGGSGEQLLLDLREVLGDKSESVKKWDALIEKGNEGIIS